MWTWELPVLNQSGTPCEGAEIIAIIPPPSYGSLIMGLMIPMAILIILGMIAFSLLHGRFLFLKVRALSMIIFFGLMCLYFDLLIMKMELSGRHSVSCQTWLFSFWLVIGTTENFFAGRLLVYVMKLIEAKIFVHRVRAAAMSGEKKKVTFVRAPKIRDIIRALLKSKGGLIQGVALEESEEEQQENLKRSSVANVSVTSSETDLNSMGMWSWCNQIFSWKNEGLMQFMLLFIDLIPTYIFMIVRTETDPLLHNNCFGCELGLVDVLFVAVSGGMMFTLVLYALWATRNETDPLGLKIEILTYVGPACIFSLPGSAWLFIYPVPHRTYKFSYYILNMFSLFFIYMIMTWVQIYNAYRKRAVAQINRKKINIEGLVRNETACELLLSHCTNDLCAENLLFYMDVQKWKTEWETATPKYLHDRAKAIFSIYLSRSSAFEVNLPGEVLDSVKNTLKNSDPTTRLPADTFDGALKEVTHVLMFDILPRFMNTPEYNQKILETNLIDELQTTRPVTVAVRQVVDNSALPKASV